MLVGVSGKIESGKDTVGLIIQYLTDKYARRDGLTFQGWLDEWEDIDPEYNATASPFAVKKFADTLKDIVCLLLNCTRYELEDREFKEKELGEEWWKYEVTCRDFADAVKLNKLFYDVKYYNSVEEAEEIVDKSGIINYTIKCIKLTPRLLLQLMGTECGREILHPNIWVNALMSGYKASNFMLDNNIQARGVRFPDWIITDMRFPNELKAVKDRNGITIRVNRQLPCGDVQFNGTQEEWEELVKRNKEKNAKFNHPSETALDNATFDYIIDNVGTIEDLIVKVREILIREKII